VAAGLVSVLAMSVTTSAEDTSPVEQAGRSDYLQYCASCHGTEGHGDGPATAALATPAPDLTLVAARRDGEFPVDELSMLIDGRTQTAAHGSRQMPVWGERFTVEAGNDDMAAQIVRGRIRMLLAYLRSIQR